jgi:hypothetical protein
LEIIMIVDKLNQFCEGVAANTGAAGSYLLGNQIDLGKAADLGHTEGAYLVIKTRALLTSGAGGTISFTLASDASAAVDPTTSSKHLTTPARAVGAGGIPANTILFAGRLPYEGAVPYERFIGILQNTAVAAMTAGTIDAFLVKDLAAWKAYEAVTGD